jgi:hypothetical protein
MSATSERFFIAFLSHFASTGTISLEGKLKGLRVPEELVIGRKPTRLFRRDTIAPRTDVVVLKIEPQSPTPIVDGILRSPGIDVYHLKVAHKGELQLHWHDFDSNGDALCGPGIPKELLSELLAIGAIRSFLDENECKL